MEASKRGLKRGLFGRKRVAILFLDTTWFNEVPPLRNIWSKIGEQAEVPIIGANKTVGLTGVLSLRTGAFWSYGSKVYTRDEFEEILINVRSHWRGWHIVLFLDKHSAQKCPSSRGFAERLGIQLRFLPTATPELNPVDHLWRAVKGDVAANEPTPNVVKTVRRACDYVRSLLPRDRLRKAGLLSADSWMKDLLH